MILIFGGTTEGRMAADVLDHLQLSYIYSVKSDVHKEIKGQRVFGGLDQNQMLDLCRDKNIRLIINAAHPFANELHQNIYIVKQQLNLPVLRVERNYPDLEKHNLVKLFDSFSQLSNFLEKSGYQNILALTGVQTIKKFRSVWENRNCYFRILNSELSLSKARESGIRLHLIRQADPIEDDILLSELVIETKASCILTKESGISGQIECKIRTAEVFNIPLFVVKKPVLPTFEYMVNSKMKLLQVLLDLRKDILKGNELRNGYTTGSCVSAAASAAFRSLIENKEQFISHIELPNKEHVKFLCFEQERNENMASYLVIKDGGDDPDITHTKEIGCTIKLSNNVGIHIKRGKGIGLVTLPGLQVEVGQPAINPVPRSMIQHNLEVLINDQDIDTGLEITPFVPEGEELAKKTFNPRIGIIGGISIIGTSGKVFPYSSKAFLGAIEQQIKVACELGCKDIVITSGKRSENILKNSFPQLPPQAFIHFGNFIGETLRMAEKLGVQKIHLGIMPGKAIKLAESNLDTHSKKVVFKPEFAAKLAKETGYNQHIIKAINELKIANAIANFIPYKNDEAFYLKVADKAVSTAKSVLKTAHLDFILILNEKELIWV